MRDQIEAAVSNQTRISDEQAHYLYTEASLDDLQRWATIVRNRFHAPDKATYLIMRIINYTNVCVAQCDYCAFYRLPRDPDTYLTSMDDIYAKIDEIIELGGDFVGFNGGFNPKLKIDWYEKTFSSLRERYGDTIEFYALTVAEMMYVAKLCRISYEETCQRLKAAGVRWITGGGSEILTNEFRERHSPLKYTADDYVTAQEAVIRSGLGSTATMVIGFDETIDERIEHLRRMRELQDRTDGGLFSFLSWTYKPWNTELGGEEVSAEAYLRHLATSRIYLDNFVHMRASVLTQNANALRGLNFGANDFDIPWEDEVTQKAGAVINQNIQEILDAARAQGFEPVFRPTAKATLAAQGQPS